ncbi:hypothetical protein ACFZAD_24455 [Streptomyces iakyrus]|uniref:hypothetical protein n=1 Tax=Streptomyces iakyrus TaxID=68219 RepID=UPI0036E299AD
MGQRVIKFSDLSGKNIENEDEVVRIVVTQHPDIEAPVEIEAMPEELTDVDDNALDLVTFELHYPGEGETESVIMEVDAFNKLATDTPMGEVLKAARKVTRVPSQSAGTAKKVNYATLEHAGKPKKGKTSDEEKKIVQENFDAINERLKADGMRTIDLDNEDHVSRYGLEDLVAERKAKPAKK